MARRREFRISLLAGRRTSISFTIGRKAMLVVAFRYRYQEADNEESGETLCGGVCSD
jgi:hypothetical protein